jgi:hypothetical protein
MTLPGGWALPVIWSLLGGVIVVASLRARRNRVAYATAVWAVSVLWVAAGAGVNLVVLAGGSTYTGFASGSPVPFVRDTWESLVVPNHHFFIGLLIAFEAAVGLTVLRPGRPRMVALALLVLFNLTLVAFGWAFLMWAAPMVLSLVLLLLTASSRGGASVSEGDLRPITARLFALPLGGFDTLTEKAENTNEGMLR